MSTLVLCGLVLGIPFPLGIRDLVLSGPDDAREDRIAGAWAANGASSVVASVSAPLVAMSLGNALLFACAGACYASALGGLLLAARRARGRGADTSA
jgi:hypothetical protein